MRKNTNYSSKDREDSSIFNKSGQNVMSNNMSNDKLVLENKRLKIEINKKNKEIEDCKKRVNILQEEIKKLKNITGSNKDKNRGRSVGMKNNINYNNYMKGGMFGNYDDPFNSSFFRNSPDDEVNNNRGNFGFRLNNEDSLDQSLMDKVYSDPDNLTYEQMIKLEQKIDNACRKANNNRY